MDGFTSISIATLVCGWLFTCLAALTILVNIVERKEQNWKVYGYDCVIWVAFVVALGIVAQTTWAVVAEGQGRHVDQESGSQIKLVAKVVPRNHSLFKANLKQSLLVNECLWTLVTTLTRLAAVDMMRVAFSSMRSIRILAVCMLWLTSVHGIATISAGLLVCKPLQAAWDPAAEGNCQNEVDAFVICEATGLGLDMIIFTTPMYPIFFLLTLPRQKKINLAMLFSVGALVTIVTGLRLAALRNVNSTDVTYYKGYLGLLSVVGALAGLFLAGSPSLAATNRRFRDFQGRAASSRRTTFLRTVVSRPGASRNVGNFTSQV